MLQGFCWSNFDSLIVLKFLLRPWFKNEDILPRPSRWHSPPQFLHLPIYLLPTIGYGSWPMFSTLHPIIWYQMSIAGWNGVPYAPCASGYGIHCSMKHMTFHPILLSQDTRAGLRMYSSIHPIVSLSLSFSFSFPFKWNYGYK